ncbi:MAG: PIF1 family DEAD/DEAH box helicase [bacterium]|nr:PIF1 family DEAD/DEAH box helicase [bacterium]
MKQEKALSYLKEGHNVFITGPAGSGKTYLLNEYIDWLRKENINVAITASTGIAATHIGGQTIHSWSAIGIKDSLSEYDLDALSQKQHLYKRFHETDVLIIDEVSMLHSYRLDMVDKVLKKIRNNDEPFGGLQVVLSGDYFQLPPINRGYSSSKNFAFEAEVWKQLDLSVCYLDRVFRQDEDPLLIILEELRAGELSEDSMFKLQERTEESAPEDTPVTRLYTHNVDVDRLNADELTKLPGESQKFRMTSYGKKADVDTLVKNCLAPEVLELKISAQVMFVKNNFQSGYVNGTLGTVIDFEFGSPIVETLEGKRIVVEFESWILDSATGKEAEIRQFPLRLAWAITVHKSQGMTLDAAEIDLSKSFVAGMGYVALSRVSTLNGLFITGANQQALSVEPLLKEQDILFQKQSSDLE